MIDGIIFNLIDNLQRIAEGFGDVCEDLIHLGGRLHPFLFGIAHTCRIVEIFAGAQADQTFVSFGILPIYKVHIVGCDQFDAMFMRQLYDHLVHLALFGIDGTIGSRIVRFMTLQFQIIILAKEIFEPKDGFLSLVNLTMHDMLRDFTAKTCGRGNDTFVIFFQKFLVDTWTSIEALGPGDRDHLDQVLVTLLILGQQDQMPTAQILLGMILSACMSTIAFAADDRLEDILSRL